MIGDRLQQLAHRLVSQETYTTTVAPAIADLQYEARLGTWALLRAYAGVHRTLVTACVSELAADVNATARASATCAALGASVLMLLCLTAAQLLLIGPRLADRMPWHHAALLIPLWLPILSGTAIPAAVLPAAAVFAATGARRARRAAVVLALMIGLSLLFVSRLVHQPAFDLFRDFGFASTLAKHDPALRNRPLWELHNRFRDPLDRLKEGGRAARLRLPAPTMTERLRQEAHGLGTNAVTFIACGLIGAVWSRKRRWHIIALAVCVFTTYMLFDLAMALLHVRNIYSDPTITWARSVLLLLVACLFTLRSTEAQA